MTGRTFKGLFAAVLVTAALAFGFALPTNAYAATTQVNTYEELVSAISNAANGDTIQLTDDIDPTQTIKISSKTLTLDLNGHAIANTQDIYRVGGRENMSIICLSDNADLTVTGNGAIKGKANDCYAFDLNDAGTKLTIENGTFVGNVQAIIVYGGHLDVTGGSFSIIQQEQNISYGYVLNCIDAAYQAGTASITVYGGSFEHFDPGDNPAEGTHTNFLADCRATEQSGDTYTVIVKHDLEAHERVEPTCTEDGTEAYWQCATCEKYFSDADGNTEISQPVSIAATGHTSDEGTVTKEATCTELGEKTYKCKVCSAVLKTEEIAATGHKLVDHPRVEPTATEEGTEEYWECSVCGFFFSDAEGKNVISNPIVIPPTGKTDDGKKDDGSAKKDNTSSANKDNSGSSAKKSSSKKKAIPQTGDATNVAAMAVAGIAGLVSVAGALAYKKH